MNALLLRGLEAIAGADRSVVLVLKLTLILAAAWLLHGGLGRANPRWRVLLWRGTAVSLLVLPLLSLAGPALSLAVLPPIVDSPAAASRTIIDPPGAIGSGMPEVDERSPAVDFPPMLAQQTPSVPPPNQSAALMSADRALAATSPWTIATYLWLAWALGLLIGAVQEGVARIRLGRLRCRAIAADPAVAAQAADIATQLGCSKPLDVLVTPELASPCICGSLPR